MPTLRQPTTALVVSVFFANPSAGVAVGAQVVDFAEFVCVLCLTCGLNCGAWHSHAVVIVATRTPFACWAEAPQLVTSKHPSVCRLTSATRLTSSALPIYFPSSWSSRSLCRTAHCVCVQVDEQFYCV